MNGGCHVVAQILKRRFPSWDVVAYRHGFSVKHVALRSGDRVMDIRGIRSAKEVEAIYRCAPVSISLDDFEYQGSGLFHDEDFMEPATNILSTYINSHLALSVNKEETS